MKNKAKIAIAVLILVLIGLLFVAANNNNNQNDSKESVVVVETADQESNDLVTYDGVEGQTALALLKEKAEVETQDSEFGEFVVSINGENGDGQKFWLYYINGEAASVGAGTYETKNGDKIEWRLE